MSYWNPRRWKLAHRLAFHRVDTWIECGPWRTPGIEWECVTCRGAEVDQERAA